MAFASLIGTTIEWYDFFIFGTAAALIFNKVFFPSFDPVTGTLAAFASFSAGFIAGPLAAWSSPLRRQDRQQANARLLAVAHGCRDGADGLLPGYASIGIWAPMLLVVLRFAQGFGVGGEWGGAGVISCRRPLPSTAVASTARQPRVVMLASFLLGNGAVRPAVGNADRTSSSPRVGMAGSIPRQRAAHRHRHVNQAHRGRDPVFQKTLDAKPVAEMPVLDALKTYPKEIALASGHSWPPTPISTSCRSG